MSQFCHLAKIERFYWPWHASIAAYNTRWAWWSRRCLRQSVHVGHDELTERWPIFFILSTNGDVFHRSPARMQSELHWFRILLIQIKLFANDILKPFQKRQRLWLIPDSQGSIQYQGDRIPIKQAGKLPHRPAWYTVGAPTQGVIDGHVYRYINWFVDCIIYDASNTWARNFAVLYFNIIY